MLEGVARIYLYRTKTYSSQLRARPHPGVLNRNRCGNRTWGRSGTRIWWVHTGQHLGVSEVVGGMFHPDNGAKHQTMRILNRCSQATLRVSLDENMFWWTESVRQYSLEDENALRWTEYVNQSSLEVKGPCLEI